MAVFKDAMLFTDLEREYANCTSIQHRKKYAQFFTPTSIADLMARWILGNPNLRNVLEPAFGLGVFSRALLKYKEGINIKGYEIDSNILQKAKKHFASVRDLHLLQEDYMYNDWNNRYDGIVCNPPYFKFHDYDNKNILKEIEEKTSCKLNGFTNLYTLFLLKSIHQLSKGGRCAYIIPSEFLNSDYGKEVKYYLVKSKMLRHVFVVDFEENVFDDALTTACILLLANDENSETIDFTNIKHLSDLTKIEDTIKCYPSVRGENTVPLSEIKPEIKWRAYYQKQNALRFKNLVPFSNYGKVVRGIATGANEYFTFNRSKIEQHSVSSKYLLPCICKAIDAKNAFFTEEQFKKLEIEDRSVYLLNAVDSNDKNVEKYLELGVHEGINKRYLTASRNPWYALEKRPPAPIWVSVFNRNGLRFIRNEANIYNLTTFHCIYLNLFSTGLIDLFFAYLLTDVSKDIFADNRREYGNGLEKFEPNDINNSKMVNLDQLSVKAKDKILKFVQQYKISELGNEPQYELIKEINEIFVKEFSL